MKPAQFSVLRIKSEDELCQVLAAHEGDARILAGGQSLIPMMNFRIATPPILLDITSIAELKDIQVDDAWIVIGSLCPHADIEDSLLLKAHCPLLPEAVTQVAHRAIRNKGTIGGSLALCYPSAELPLALILLDAIIELRSIRGSREVAAQDFLLGMLETAIATDEYIRTIRIPRDTNSWQSGFNEVTRRHGDFAISAAAVRLKIALDGSILDARIGISGGLACPQRLLSVEHFCQGKTVNKVNLEQSISDALSRCEIFGDSQYPTAYRKKLLTTSVTKAFAEARERRHQNVR